MTTTKFFSGTHAEDLAPTGKAFAFPAGERHFTAPDGPVAPLQVAYLRGCSHDDLFSVALWANAYRDSEATRVLLLPYLPAARADRGRPFGAKVYADFINAMGVDQVICFDPHSPVAPSLLANVTIVESASIVADALNGEHYDGVIAPDKGAAHRAALAAEALGVPLFHAGKTRDFATGALTGFTCEPLPAGGRFLVVDDICDGGGTFLGLATELGLPREQLGLYVSHGVFSGHAPNLTSRYGHILTTDSYPGITTAQFTDTPTIITLLPYLLKEIVK